ncbi:eosinophil cationic protein-like [Peromyscus eremicus]|uniref:eosinophil cationic protein-like n=1 Tax=Peromyscus eremicus TaxID=42410 RepID=UPI0027DC0214|nr:eosinophil cationic protein-like [Peromyscus eremicus]
MGVKLLESRLRLLPLLLGLVMVVASFQIPPYLTPSQWFEIQHVIMTSPRCTAAMRSVNRHTGQCKNLNSFLHTSFAAVVTVCGRSNVNCSDRVHSNCHNSPAPVSLTYCNLTTPGSHYTQCQYQTTRTRKFYRVACDYRTPRDNRTYPVVPVHLDGIF